MSEKHLKRSILLVDDDAAVQRGVAALLTAVGYETTIFASAEEFLSRLASLDLDDSVMLVDVCMPGIQGLELQEQLNEENIDLPVVVMTAHGDIPMAVRAMRNGAVDFLQKPFTVDEVTAALDRAFVSASAPAKSANPATPELEASYKTLTPRENDVLQEIVNGHTNKEIARELAISPRTVEVHRQKIMSKMNASNLAELVRMAVTLNIGQPAR